VRVCGLSNCITTKLTDWCLCGHGRIIDLDRRAFSRLADPSVGILRVTVMPRLGGYAIPHVTVPRPTAPATDTSEDQP
jgi:rare lipoprotein A (peptidoglycan hydrolase)